MTPLDYLVSVIILSCNLKGTHMTNVQQDCVDFFNNCSVKYNKELEKKDVDECKKRFYKHE